MANLAIFITKIDTGKQLSGISGIGAEKEIQLKNVNCLKKRVVVCSLGHTEIN